MASLPMNMSYGDAKMGLQSLTKECQTLWEENKDMQGRFVNDLSELQRFQMAISQLEQTQRHDQMRHAQQCQHEMQQRASQLYEQLTERRMTLTRRLNDGIQQIAMLQGHLINERLLDWKNRQKLSQIGVPFDNRDALLDDIQMDFEMITENNWQLRTFACWQLDLLRRSPQLSDNTAQSHITNLSTIHETLTKLLCMLVSQSFVVAVQPDPVLKTQHKFVSEVRLLIGDRLGIKQHLVNANVTVKIIAEEEARMLSVSQITEKEIKTVGSISNDFEKMVFDEKGHLSAKFNNSKLTRIAHRKPPPKGLQNDSQKSALMVQTATDQKYALLFHITPFQLGNLGKFDVWTLSLPLMVTVHGSQDCDAQGVILWQRAFSPVTRTSVNEDISAVSWQDLKEVLRHKFSLFTGTHRSLNEQDLAYLAEKLILQHGPELKPITFHRFAKQNLHESVTFSFWEWFFLIMQLIKQKLLKFWDEGWLIGFISKNDASQRMVMNSVPTFLLRFSDTQTGGCQYWLCLRRRRNESSFSSISVHYKRFGSTISCTTHCFVSTVARYQIFVPGHRQRGGNMLRVFDGEERKSESPTSYNQGYIQSEIVMIAKTRKVTSNFGGDSPSPMSNNSKLDWSPGEFQTPSMDMNDELVTMLSHSQLETANVESLLGAGFRPQAQPLQQIDLSFIDQTFNNYAIHHPDTSPSQ
ncbi:Signal transducer and activator of transcription [Aphelenchoides bicaudatus]|nr:Signal transducer and activator of transcription [Aphelenchoides bicaudatus]